jgi:hypothetical protein
VIPWKDAFTAVIGLDDLRGRLPDGTTQPVCAHSELLQRGGGTFGQLLSASRARRVKLTPELPFVSVLYLDELGAVNWREAEANRPTTPGKLAKAGDVIMSLLNPAKFRAGGR